MDYPLESLDPETFQRLCQAILVCEYPEVQCFPVAQPDGGRDAVVDTPAKYPGFLVAMAETAMNTATSAKVVPVGDIADQQEWSFS